MTDNSDAIKSAIAELESASYGVLKALHGVRGVAETGAADESSVGAHREAQVEAGFEEQG
jgi:hypothetical protein